MEPLYRREPDADHNYREYCNLVENGITYTSLIDCSNIRKLRANFPTIHMKRASDPIRNANNGNDRQHLPNPLAHPVATKAQKTA